jgi:LytS/YehU family sensor histidine kinase
MRGIEDPRKIVFVALMGALGNVMFIVSQTIFKATQIALDLSHIGTFIAAVYGGPWIGFLTGLIVGIGPGLNFGYFGGSLGLLGVIGLPMGKALTGLTVGYLTRFFKLENAKHSAWKISLTTLIGYVPECIFTVFYFEWLIVILLPDVAASFTLYFGSIHLLVLSILAKAWVEIALLSIFMGTLVGNNGFDDFVTRVFTKSTITPKIGAKKPD